MDDLLMVLGVLVVAFGAGLVFLPAGVITFGVFLLVGGVAKARVGRKSAAS